MMSIAPGWDMSPLTSSYWTTSCVISLLVLSFHAMSSPSLVEAFSSTSQLANQQRRPGLDLALFGRTRRQRQLHPCAISRQNIVGPTLSRQRQQNQQLFIHGRPFSKFYVASTSGPLVNFGDNNKNPAEDESEEYLWECIIDPNSDDECAYYRQSYTPLKKTGTWSLRPEEVDHVTLKDKAAMAAAAVTGIASFAVLIFFSGPGAWRFFLAGGLCAAASHAIPTPIDVVKTKKQVDFELQSMSFILATRKIIKDEGAGALWAGLGPTICGYLLEGAMKFGVYEVLKPTALTLLQSLSAATSLPFLKNQVIAFVICGIVAGTAASFVLAPMEALRIRLVSEPSFAPKGMIQGARRMVKREGVLSLWRGIKPQIYKQVPYTVTKNVSFDYLTRMAYSVAIAGGVGVNAGTKTTIPLLAAAVTSILACISSQPGDMLLSLVSAHQGEVRSTHDFAKDILKSDKGIRGFFVGLNCRMYHMGITVTLQLVLYDFLKRLCGGVATGM